MKKYLELFVTMLKIGMFTFGGGYAMIALLENETVSKRNWISADEFLDLVAIAESTPGPIAINASTYIGYRTAGFGGALFATVGMCLPSFVIIYLISIFFDSFLSIRLVGAAFRGIRVCVVYLIFSAGLKMLKGMKKTAFNLSVLMAVAACLIAGTVFSLNFSTIVLILICGCLGLAVHFAQRFRKEGEK